MKIFLFFIFLPVLALAQVKVAFIEMTGQNGKLIELEKGARISHLAISYHGQWLHADPYHGVQIISQKQLEAIGLVTDVIEIQDHAEPSEEFVHSILGTPYESTFSWESDKYYCSKLVGKFLGLQPKSMQFDTSIWPTYFQKYKGLPGLSPQDIFNRLLKMGYKSKRLPARCEKIFQ